MTEKVCARHLRRLIANCSDSHTMPSHTGSSPSESIHNNSQRRSGAANQEPLPVTNSAAAWILPSTYSRSGYSGPGVPGSSPCIQVGN